MNDTQVQDQSVDQPDLSQNDSPQESNQSPVPSAQELVDLDKLEKFRFAGREMTKDELKNSYMFQSDYTKKTQQLADQRKAFQEEQQKWSSYRESYKVDVQAVLAGKYTREDFKKVYPEPYWHLVDGNEQANPVRQGVQQPNQLPPEVAELMEFKNQWKEERIQLHESKIDATMAKMTQKFPDAEAVRVLDLAKQWKSHNPKAQEIPEKVWEKIYTAEQKRFEELSDKRQQRLMQAQKTANQQGRDVASGGGTPGQAPRQFKTIKEASQAMMESNTI